LSTRERERGAVAVEFALVLPLFLLLVLGGIDWGFYFYCSQAAANAAREGARAGSIVRGTDLNPALACQGNGTDRGAIDTTNDYLQTTKLIPGNPDPVLRASDPRLRAYDCASGNGCCRTICVPAMTATSATPPLCGAGNAPAVELTVVYQFRYSSDSMSLTGFLPGALLPRTVQTTSTMRLEP
jgi:Flp pilus assembly protein TadG